jgi:hypothetical protein
MKYLKKFRLFEGKLTGISCMEIDLAELEQYLIDFKQMGLDYDIKAGSSIVIDWREFNDVFHGGTKVLYSSDISKFTKSTTNDSLTIEFETNEIQDYNINDTVEAYEMLKDYLFDNYNLIPNYIYINYHWNYMYFQNFHELKNYKDIFSQSDILGSSDKNIFKAHKVIFGFYKDKNARLRF